jgi:hypothetical protein
MKRPDADAPRMRLRVRGRRRAPAGAARIGRAWLAGGCVAAAALALGVIASAAGAAPGSSHFTFVGEVGVGRDDNPLRERAARHRGPEYPYDLTASYGLRPVATTRIAFSAHGTGALYASPNRDARTTEEGADLRWTQRLLTGDRRRPEYARLDLQLRGSVDQLHRSNVSRSAGEEFTVVVDGDTISLKDRFNYRAAGFGADLTLRWPPSSEWSVGYDRTRRDYIEDYRSVPTVDPLDYYDTGVDVGLTQKIPGALQGEFGYRWAKLAYDALAARDFDGNVVAGTRQIYRYTSWRTGIATRRSAWGRLRIAYARRARTDPFMGYFDYREWAITPSCEWTPTPRWELSLGFEYAHRTYARAHVGYNPVKPLRDDIDRSVTARALYRVNAWGAVLAQVIRENDYERNPLYAYERSRGWIGIQVRH